MRLTQFDCGACVTRLAGTVERSATVDVTAHAWGRTTELLELVMFGMSGHVSKPNDFVAKMTFGRPPAIGEFVWCEV